jgi:hypothetical protein
MNENPMNENPMNVEMTAGCTAIEQHFRTHSSSVSSSIRSVSSAEADGVFFNESFRISSGAAIKKQNEEDRCGPKKPSPVRLIRSNPLRVCFGFGSSFNVHNRMLLKLDLADLGTQGTICSAIGELICLKDLDLSGNRLTGNFPKSIACLKNLEWLRVQKNNLSGLLPANIGVSCLMKLKRLDVSRNPRLGGEIAPTLLKNGTCKVCHVYRCDVEAMQIPFLTGVSLSSDEIRWIYKQGIVEAMERLQPYAGRKWQTIWLSNLKQIAASGELLYVFFSPTFKRKFLQVERWVDKAECKMFHFDPFLGLAEGQRAQSILDWERLHLQLVANEHQIVMLQISKDACFECEKPEYYHLPARLIRPIQKDAQYGSAENATDVKVAMVQLDPTDKLIQSLKAEIHLLKKNLAKQDANEPVAAVESAVVDTSTADEKLVLAQEQLAEAQGQLAELWTRYYRTRGRSNSSDGSCVASDSRVVLADGTTCAASEISVGDMVFSLDSRDRQAMVELVFKAQVTRPIVALHQPGHSPLRITHKHPIKHEGKWIHPRTLAPPSSRNMEICNFVLDRGHSMLINGFQCVTMGGGESNPTYGTDVENPYYIGEVVADLLRSQSATVRTEPHPVGAGHMREASRTRAVAV